MPNLLALLACDRVVIDKGDNSVHAQNIFTTIHVRPLQNGAALQGLIPFRWVIFTHWQPADISEMGKTWTQRLVMVGPSGLELFRGELPLPISAQRAHTSTFKLQHFAFDGFGRYTATLTLINAEEEAEEPTAKLYLNVEPEIEAQEVNREKDSVHS